MSNLSELKLTLVAGELDAAMLKKLAVIERVSLTAVLVILAGNLVLRALVSGARAPFTGWPLMGTEAILIALFGALSLDFSNAHRGRRLRQLALWFTGLLVLACTVILIEHIFHLSFAFQLHIPAVSGAPVPLSVRLSPQIASGFLLLGVTLFLSAAENRALVLFGDFVACGLILLSLTLVSGQILDTMRIFGPPVDGGFSAQSAICLFLLVLAALARRSRSGVLSILAGSGAGSRVARVISPILLLLPYLRELLRAQLLNDRRMPPPYMTAFIATVAMIVSISLLLYLAWRMNAMEVEIRALSLRDELTGLYNLRGFRLLAEQALRMAHRSGGPFSVLFIDLDDLKRTNDSLGHQAGSQSLVETARILKAAFREADVLGRVGGDEFAVAGEFSPAGIRQAAHRLTELAARRNSVNDLTRAIGFSVGHVTAETGEAQSLDSLLAQADHAMYQEKRRKKVAVN